MRVLELLLGKFCCHSQDFDEAVASPAVSSCSGRRRSRVIKAIMAVSTAPELRDTKLWN